MKSYSWMFWVALCGITMMVIFQLYARPIIDRVHSKYDRHEREAFCLLREQSAREYNND